jgi:hypothetical protein
MTVLEGMHVGRIGNPTGFPNACILYSIVNKPFGSAYPSPFSELPEEFRPVWIRKCPKCKSSAPPH